MKIDTFSKRLEKALSKSNVSQTELAKKTNIDKSLINKYLKGIAEAGNDNLSSIASVLNVNEVWLMGYDVPMNNNENVEKKITTNDNLLLQYQLLFDKDDRLTPEEKKFIVNYLKAKHKEIDKEMDNKE